jgi:hypothetical protein
MSSQGPTGQSGYGYQVLRDAADYTRQLKEQRAFKSYNSANTANTDTGPTWMKFDNGFKLTYDFGKLACAGSTGNAGCTGNAFGGQNATVGGS